MPVAGKGAAIRDLGESDYKRNCQPQLTTGQRCLRRLRDPADWQPLSCPRHGLGAQAGGPPRTNWPSGTERRSCWAAAKKSAGLAAPGICGDSPLLPKTLSHPRRPGKNLTRRERRRQRRRPPLSERLRWRAGASSVVGGKLLVSWPGASAMLPRAAPAAGAP